MIATKKTHQKITAEDLLKGKVICYKCIAMAALSVINIGLGVRLFSPTSELFNHVGLISWLSLIMGSTLYFVCVNRSSKTSETKMVLKNGYLVIYENGRRKIAENVNSINANLVSCQCSESGFKPAILLKGRKIGKVSIGSEQDQFDWLHFKTFIKRTEFVVDDSNSWNELMKTFNQSHSMAA